MTEEVKTMKYLLIRADDLGYSEGVNYGIAAAVAAGLVRSVGVMTNMPLLSTAWGCCMAIPCAWASTPTSVWAGPSPTFPHSQLVHPRRGIQAQPHLPGGRQSRSGLCGSGGGH